MQVLRIALAGVAAVLLASTPAAAQHSVLSNGARRTLDCDGQDVKVSGSKNELTLRGNCPRVDVAGAANVISIDAADRIEVTGSGNRVTWQRGVSRETPRVSSTGLNTVQRAAASGDAPSTTAESRRDRQQSPPPEQSAPSGTPAGRSTAASSSSEDVSVLTSNGSHSIDCRGRNVRILGSRNRVTLGGECPEVQIAGDDNTVSIEVAGRISVPGEGNEVTWTRVSTGQEPRTIVTGERNQIARKR
jgi:hypothetical protein